MDAMPVVDKQKGSIFAIAEGMLPAGISARPCAEIPPIAWLAATAP
jgi:hypothetical protein